MGGVSAQSPPPHYDFHMPDAHQDDPRDAPDNPSNNGPALNAHAARPSQRQPNRQSAYPESVQRLIDAFSRLPGIGARTAERLAFFVLKSPEQDAFDLAAALADVKHNVRSCSICFNLTEQDPCPICRDENRQKGLLLVVEQPKDLISLEQTGMHKGVYHVLMGRISPLEGVGPDDLTIDGLLRRVDDPQNNGGEPVEEVILGLTPTVEGDGTALHLAEELRRRGARVTRLARGLPSGAQLEYVSKAALADAIQGRQSME